VLADGEQFARLAGENMTGCVQPKRSFSSTAEAPDMYLAHGETFCVCPVELSSANIVL